MRELRCIDCGQALGNGLGTFGAIGREQCQFCYLVPLERLNDIDEADEYTQLLELEIQPENESLSITQSGYSTQLLE